MFFLCSLQNKKLIIVTVEYFAMFYAKALPFMHMWGVFCVNEFVRSVSRQVSCVTHEFNA